MMKYAAAAAALTTAIIATGFACAQDPKNVSGSIEVDGSSTVYPLTTAIDEDFRAAGSKVKVNVGSSGTGGGFKRFATGDIDISNASRPIKKEEAEAAKKAGVEFIEIPVAYDGLSIVVNKKNTFIDYITMDDLRMIFRAGNPAKSWKDVRPNWPDQPIKIFSPGTDSGTFDYFKEEVVGKEGKIRSDLEASEDDNVLVSGVAGNEFAIGFFGYSYYVANKDKIRIVKVDAGKGAIEPTPQTIEDGTYAPFSRPLFIYVNKKSAARPEVKAFVDFYLKNVSGLTEELGFVKLPDDILGRASKNWAASKTGTQYLNAAGEKVSGPLSKVYN